MKTKKTENEINKIKKWEEKIEQEDLKYKGSSHMYDFEQFEAVRSFGDTGKISKDEEEMDQTSLLENMVNFNNKSRPTSKQDKDKIRNTFSSVNALYDGPELTVNAFRSEIFPIKAT